MRSRADRFISELLRDSASCVDQRALALRVIDRLGAIVPFDSAILVPIPLGPLGPVAVNRDARHLALYRMLMRRPGLLLAGYQEKAAAAIESRGLYLDTELFTSGERRHLPFYSEIVHPQGITSQIEARISFHGHTRGRLFLCRHGGGTGLRPRDVDALEPLLPVIGTCWAALAAQPSAPSLVVEERLSTREREIVGYVSRGFRNQDIAVVLDRSPNTVRNHLARIFEKLEVSNRAELVAVNAESAQTRLRGTFVP